MITDGSSQNLIKVYSCADAQGTGLILADKQQMKEPIETTQARIHQIEGLGTQVVELSDGVDRDFCEAHCDPDNCIKYTGETIVELNTRVLRSSGTDGKASLIAKMKESDELQANPRESDCPYLGERIPLEELTEELLRGVDPDELVRIGYTDEHPHTPGEEIVKVIDPVETALAIRSMGRAS